MAEGDIANEAQAGIDAAEQARDDRAAAQEAREELAAVDPEAAAEMGAVPGEDAPDEGRVATKAEKDKAKKNAVPRSERTYSKERLIAEGSDFLGYPPHVVAGGLADVDDDELTVADAKSAVAAWLKREV